MKLDREALAAADVATAIAANYAPPGMSSKIAGIWQTLLRTRAIGRHDNFFALGGYSSLAMQLVGRIAERWSGK